MVLAQAPGNRIDRCDGTLCLSSWFPISEMLCWTPFSKCQRPQDSETFKEVGRKGNEKL
jgi:hypothetical protein